jgi:hypothetical protein
MYQKLFNVCCVAHGLFVFLQISSFNMLACEDSDYKNGCILCRRIAGDW